MAMSDGHSSQRTQRSVQRVQPATVSDVQGILSPAPGKTRKPFSGLTTSTAPTGNTHIKHATFINTK